MSSGTINGTTGNQYIASKITWSYTQNTSANTSTVTATLWYKRTNSGFATSGTGNFIISIDGSSYRASKYILIAEMDWIPAISFTKTINHNSDGTRAISISASGSIKGTTLTSTTCSANVTLTTIPRPSTVSARAITLGSNCNVTWTPHSQTFRYKLMFSLGDWSHTTDLMHPNTTSAYTYTGYQIPLDVAYKVPTKKGTMIATLFTYSDSGNELGSTSTPFEVTVPNNSDTKPTITSMEFSPEHSLPSAFSGLYIQGKSKLIATINADGKYDATISSTSVYIDGVSYQSEYLLTAGTKTVVGRATDSRGYYDEDTKTIEVIPYSNPQIIRASDENEIICARCDAEGNITESGAYLKIKAARSYSEVMSTNKCKFQYRCKWASGEEFTDYITLLEKDATTDKVDAELSGVVDVSKAYIVELRVIDDIGGASTMTFTIPTAGATFHLREGGNGAAFGKYAEVEKALDINPDWIVIYKGRAIADFVIDSDVSGLWNYRRWLSGEAELWGRIELTYNDARSLKCVAGLPFQFDGKPTVIMTLSEATAYDYRQGQIVLSEVYTDSATTPTITLSMIRNEGGLVEGNTADVSVSIKGKWKETEQQEEK